MALGTVRVTAALEQNEDNVGILTNCISFNIRVVGVTVAKIDVRDVTNDLIKILLKRTPWHVCPLCVVALVVQILIGYFLGRNVVYKEELYCHQGQDRHPSNNI